VLPLVGIHVVLVGGQVVPMRSSCLKELRLSFPLSGFLFQDVIPYTLAHTMLPSTIRLSSKADMGDKMILNI
jgi:hypothetical protein